MSVSFRRFFLLTGVAILAFLFFAFFWGREAYNLAYPLPAGIQSKYVGNSACAECHENFYKRWSLSYHAKSMDHAKPESVLGDFCGTPLIHSGETTSFIKKESKYFAIVKKDKAKEIDYEVKYVLGFYPLQEYLVEFPDGKIQCLPWAWDVEGKKWYHLYSNEETPEGDVLHWRQPTQNWNYMCASCHVTNLKRNFNFEKKTYNSTFTEINNGCESCHGPGSLHIQIAQRNGGKSAQDRRYGCGLFTFRNAAGKDSTQACAPCHARRVELYPDWRPGEKFCDYYFPELLDSDAFYPDGQIKDEDFEYSSFLQSKFYAQGGSCADCHDAFIARVPHLRSDGFQPKPVSEMCAKCHDDNKYNSPEHHFHKLAKNAAGTRCEDCHMPATRYMGVDNRRDHSMSAPRPRLTADLGVPNACNSCHNDKSKGETPQWAQEKIDSWYGKQDYSRHFAYAIAAGRKRQSDADAALCNLVSNRELQNPQDKNAPFVPDMVRASAAALLANYSTGRAKSTLLNALKDESELVRTAAARALEYKFTDGKELQQYFTLLLSDPIRSVRMEAARQLSAVMPSAAAPGKEPSNQGGVQLSDFEKALAEYITGQEFLSDQAASHLNLGVLEENAGRVQAAERYFRNALELDSAFYPARNNLAMTLYKQNRVQEAEAEFRTIVKLHPEAAEGWYSLGLLLAENEKSWEESADCFLKASKLNMDNARVFYNLGLAMYRLKQYETAEKALLQAVKMEPNNRDFINAVIYFYRETDDSQKELQWVEYLNRTP